MVAVIISSELVSNSQPSTQNPRLKETNPPLAQNSIKKRHTGPHKLKKHARDRPLGDGMNLGNGPFETLGRTADFS